MTLLRRINRAQDDAVIDHESVRRSGGSAALFNRGLSIVSAITATANGTTINTAFLQEIKNDNQDLKRLLSYARHVCARGKWVAHCRRRLASVLGCLRDRLAMHFALEEACGYFDEPVAEAPHLHERVCSLRSEHTALFLNICDVADRAEQFARDTHTRRGGEDVVRGFQEFDKEFHDHEKEECELMMQAFDEDLGVGD